MKYCDHCHKEYPDDLAVCSEDGHVLVSEDGKTKGDPFIGRVIMDKYRVLKLLGRGGMGAVYEGRHLLLDRQIAIKVMNSQIVSDQMAVARFIREAKTSAMLDHPNAVTIHDFGVLEDGGAFIVMEFIRGQSLRKVLSVSGPLPIDKALELFAPVCSAVEAAHKRGIIHRDLKPENIMLKESPEGLVIKVVDFGLAKLSTGDSGHSAKLSKTGDVMGTPQYMAPEFFDGEEADRRSDIYALGIIFYEMITGTTPFTGTLESVIAGHLLKEPKPLRQVNPLIDLDLDDAIKLALKKRREERIGSAIEYMEYLKTAASQTVSNREIEYEQIPVAAQGAIIKTPGTEQYSAISSTGVISKTERNTLIVENPTKFVGEGGMNLQPESYSTTPIITSQEESEQPFSGFTTKKSFTVPQTRVIGRIPFKRFLLLCSSILILLIGGVTAFLISSVPESESVPQKVPAPNSQPISVSPTSQSEETPFNNRKTNRGSSPSVRQAGSTKAGTNRAYRYSGQAGKQASQPTPRDETEEARQQPPPRVKEGFEEAVGIGIETGKSIVDVFKKPKSKNRSRD
jgi:serine/threonine protein kinase